MGFEIKNMVDGTSESTAKSIELSLINHGTEENFKYLPKEILPEENITIKI